jgi:hypothetical protein
MEGNGEEIREYYEQQLLNKRRPIRMTRHQPLLKRGADSRLIGV